LDKETSGCLLIPLTALSAKEFTQQFAENKVGYPQRWLEIPYFFIHFLCKKDVQMMQIWRIYGL
jgi:hypothetical protein